MQTVLKVNDTINLVYGHNDPLAHEAYLAAKDAGRAEGCSSSVSTACPTKGQAGL